jgi:hypothetical protein
MRTPLFLVLGIVLLVIVPIPGIGRPLIAFVNYSYDANDLGSWGDPNRPLYAKYRNDRRVAVQMMRKHLDGDKSIAIKDPLAKDGTTPADYYNGRHRSAELALDFSDEEARLLAEAQGRILPSRGSMSVQANQWVWHDTGYEVFAGDVITCNGAVFNDEYTDRSGAQIPIGCQGLSKPNTLDNLYTPIDPDFPTGGFSVRVVDRNGEEHVDFAGKRFQVKYAGHLFVRSNGPYRAIGSGRTHKDLITQHAGGEFNFKRIPTATTEE